MKKLLKKIGLTTALITEVSTDRSTFMKRLNQVVEKPSNGFLDLFSVDKKEYAGTVNYDNFILQRRQVTNRQNQMQASATGKVYQKGDKLVIESEITGYSHYLILFLVFIVFFYTIFIGTFFFVDGVQTGMPLLIIPFVCIHGVVMIFLPYKMLKRSVEKLKYDLEREFYYLAKS